MKLLNGKCMNKKFKENKEFIHRLTDKKQVNKNENKENHQEPNLPPLLHCAAPEHAFRWQFSALRTPHSLPQPQHLQSQRSCRSTGQNHMHRSLQYKQVNIH